MARNKKAIPNPVHTASEPDASADKAVQKTPQPLPPLRKAAEQTKVVVKKKVADPMTGRQADRRKNAFGIAASASKATAVSRSIVSRGRGGRGR